MAEQQDEHKRTDKQTGIQTYIKASAQQAGASGMQAEFPPSRQDCCFVRYMSQIVAMLSHFHH